LRFNPPIALDDRATRSKLLQESIG